MSVYTNNPINPGSSARRLDSDSLERLSALPKRVKRNFDNESPVILRVPSFNYSTSDHGLSETTHRAKSLFGTVNVDGIDATTTTTTVGDVRTHEEKKDRTTDGNGPSGSGPTEPPSSDASSQIAENTISTTKLKEKKMSSASTLWTLGLTTGALVLGSIGISLSPINEDLKKFLHVCAYSLTAFTGILLAALGLTEISDRTGSKKSTNSNEEI